MKKKTESAKRKSEAQSASKPVSSKKTIREEIEQSESKALSVTKPARRIKKTSETELKPAKKSAVSAQKSKVEKTASKISDSVRAAAEKVSEKKVKTTRTKKPAEVSEKDSIEKTLTTPRKSELRKSVPETPAAKEKKVIRIIKVKKASGEVIAIPAEETVSPKTNRTPRKKTESALENAPKEKERRGSKTPETKKPRAKRVTLKKLLAETSAKTPAKKIVNGIEPPKEDSPQNKVSPIFRELAEPKLPSLPMEDRARLQLQSPNRLFFYWSLRGMPFETLKKIFGTRAQNFFLAAKLVDLDSGNQTILPVESQGSFWFDVNSDTLYRAEIGFLSDSGSFVRLIYSNSLRTPRTSPSPFRDFSEKFHITTEKFAQVLDFSGFSRDALTVTRYDSETSRSQINSRIRALMFGERFVQISPDEEEELYFTLMSFASGISLTELRKRISQRTFDLVSAVFEKRSKERVATGLRFVFNKEFEIEEEFAPAVFGASLINFPKWKRRRGNILPVSSPGSFAKK
jgi:hypothetical protein